MIESYRVVTLGVAEGRSVADVASALAARFALPTAKWRAVLEAPRFVLKRGLSRVEAAALERALGHAGCLSAVESEVAPSAPLSPRAALRARLRGWQAAWRALSPWRRALAALAVAALVGGGAALALTAISTAPGDAAGRAPSAPPARPAARPAAATLLGAWTCRSHGPNGFYVQQHYVFRGDGGFTDDENGVAFAGSYRRRGRALVLTVHHAQQGATAFAPDLVIDARVRLLADGAMKLETRVRGSDRSQSSTCARDAQ